MARILIVEDEDALRAGMSRALSKLGDVTVDAVGTMRDALAAIDRVPPDAIISDLDLPDRIGAELLGELEARGLRVPITFVSAYTRELGALIPRSPQVRIVDKPISLEQLREVAKATLATSDSVLPPPPFGAADYLQIACMGRHSVVITVRERERDELPAGRIVVWRGELWSAKDPAGDGEEAFRRLVTHPGSFRCHTLDREPGPRLIDAPWEMLLLDAIRKADEARASAPPEPEPEPEPEPAAYDEAMEEGIEALLRHDHPAALQAFRAALAARPGDPVARANVTRLSALDEGEGGGVS